MIRTIIVFIISFIVLAILQFAINEIILLSIGIALVFALRVFWLFIIIGVILTISGFSVRTAIILAGGIALVYWLGIILVTEHKSQTWMYAKGPFRESEIRRNKVASKEYKESALDMFFGSRKRKKRNLHDINENDV